MNDKSPTYLWVIMWRGVPNRTIHHTLTLLPGASPQEFEELMLHTVFPQTEAQLTRIGSAASQYLFRDTTVIDPGRLLMTYDDAAEQLAPFVTRKSSGTWELVGPKLEPAQGST